MKKGGVLKYFAKLLRTREIMKSLQQISWSVSQIEKRYEADSVSERSAKEIVGVYLDYIPQVERLLNELMDEYEQEYKE